MARTASRATLTPDQLVAVDILATGGSLDDVQKATGVEAETVRDWETDPVFVAAVNVRTNEARDAHLVRLRAMVPAALEALEGLIDSPDPAVRLRVASYVLKAAGLDAVPWRRIDQTKPEYVANNWKMDALMHF